jgi:MFS family permease
MVAVFLMRTSIMNSTRPLTKSVLMDFVPKNQRGKWNALQSVNVFSWAGSAVVGGYLIDRFDFAGIFVTTALMQVCATIPLLLVRSRIPMEAPSDK